MLFAIKKVLGDSFWQHRNSQRLWYTVCIMTSRESRSLLFTVSPRRVQVRSHVKKYLKIFMISKYFHAWETSFRRMRLKKKFIFLWKNVDRNVLKFVASIKYSNWKCCLYGVRLIGYTEVRLFWGGSFLAWLTKLQVPAPHKIKFSNRRSGLFIVNFKHVSHLVLVFLVLTLNM